MGRRGIRVGDLLYPELFREKVRANVEFKSSLLCAIYGDQPLDAVEIADSYIEMSRDILPFVTDTAEYLNRAIRAGKSVLFEGAQGTLLDVDHGTYPFVTSSSATAGGACTGTGVGPSLIQGVIGIAKAYTTRVGGGPFPTELHDEIGEQIREKGVEFGASTGRPRRCGWFDAVVVRYASLINDLSTLVITKLDVLDEMDEIKICVGYEFQGRKMDFFPTDVSVLGRVKPIYETHPGWKQDTSRTRQYVDLPDLAKRYVARLSELIDTDISIISTGPDRTETIVLEESPRLQRLFSERS